MRGNPCFIRLSQSSNLDILALSKEETPNVLKETPIGRVITPNVCQIPLGDSTSRLFPKCIFKPFHHHLQTMDDTSLTMDESESAKGKKESAKLERRKVRAACTPCHSQKLRCVIKHGAVSCDRCVRLHKSCNFAPRAPRSSLQVRQNSAQSHEPEGMPASIEMYTPASSPLAVKDAFNESPFSPAFGMDVVEGQGMYSTDFTEDSRMDRSGAETGRLSLYDPISRNLETADNSLSFSFDEPESGSLIAGYGSTNLFENQQFHENFFAPSPNPFESLPDSFQGRQFQNPIAVAVKNLGKLSVELYEYAAKLPSMPKNGPGTEGVDSPWTAFGGTSPQQKRLLVLDEIFSLTKRFINVVGTLSQQGQDVLALFKDTTASSTREALSSPFPEQQIVRTDPRLEESGTKGPLSHLDEATTLMVMSCHCRLTDIYLSIFHMMQVCMEHSFPPQVEDDWTVVLPKLQVGSHAAPSMQVDAKSSLSRSTSSMYMLMITMLSSQLCEKIAGVMGVKGERDFRLGSSQRREVPEVSEFDLLKARVKERTGRLERTISATQGLLQRFSVVA